jgi:recombinational DNA repair protein RecT
MYKEFADISKVKEGSKLLVIGEFTCLLKNTIKIVYKDEEFNYDMATNLIHHIPIYAETEDDNKKRTILGCYSRAVLFTNDVVYEYMAMWEIDKIKKNSANSHSEHSAWKTDTLEMIKKSVIKRHFKMLISLGSANNQQVSAFIKVENENDPLKNDFNNQSKPSIKNSFLDEDEIVEETEIIETETIEKENEFPDHYDNKSEISEDDEREMFNDLFRES